jgi:hypothetical protein
MTQSPKFNKDDCVQLNRDFPTANLKQCDIGTIDSCEYTLAQVRFSPTCIAHIPIEYLDLFGRPMTITNATTPPPANLSRDYPLASAYLANESKTQRLAANIHEALQALENHMANQ